jgi:hypothetical protein
MGVPGGVKVTENKCFGNFYTTRYAISGEYREVCLNGVS